MGCIWSKKRVKYEDPAILAAQTCFKENEVKALYELFRKLSSSLVDDGYISKEEFQLGLFRTRNEQSLFADRIFQLFDINNDGFIDFGEFVRSLSIFHPEAPYSDKVVVAFQLYDIWQTGFIEPEEVKEMILALLDESDLILSDDVVQTIVDKTFKDADSNRDEKIDLEEWKEYVSRNPTLLKHMTVPYLKPLSKKWDNYAFGP
ncbi:hypothetical protein DITRI_Ditri07aG0119500 [Diplodiscus trichospermus]